MPEASPTPFSSTDLNELYKCGLAAGQSRDYAAALNYYRQAAALGSLEAENQIGVIYMAGLGVPPDHAEAHKRFRKAAEHHFAGAQNHLGLCYMQGIGVTRDYAKAMEWFQRAANQGSGNAFYHIGVLYRGGMGVTRDLAKAVEWFRKSADLGTRDGQYCLGFCLSKGEGIAQDPAQAFAWIHKAAEQSLPVAQSELASMYQHGYGISQDYAEALTWYLKAATQGLPVAENNVGWFYLMGWATERNYETALHWFSIAAEKNYAQAIHNIGSMYELGLGVEKNTNEAIQWYRKAADRGFVTSIQRLGQLSSATDSSTQSPNSTTLLPVGAVSSRPSMLATGTAGDRALKVGRTIRTVVAVLKGGMGIVHICREDVPVDTPAQQRDHPVFFTAIKSLREELLGRSEVVKRFRHEAYVWISLLRHPNVVNAWHYGEGAKLGVEGRSELLLEYAEGGNLRDQLRTGALPEEKLLRASLEFCEAMCFLFESAGIIHRDIKPENILFTKAGAVKVSDFGLVKALLNLPKNPFVSDDSSESSECGSELTQYGVVLGTLPYMSPEQFRSPHEVTVASDIYSFGVVMYEMATGRLPFQAHGYLGWRDKHFNETPVNPSKCEYASEALIQIVMKCLEKNPIARYQDFSQLREALRSYCVLIGRSELIPDSAGISELEGTMTAGDWSARGLAFKELGDNEKAFENYKRAIKLDPAYPCLNMNLGVLLCELGRVEESVHHLEKEVELHPDEPWLALAYLNLSHHYRALNRDEDVLPTLRKAANLAGDDLWIWRSYVVSLGHAKAPKEDFDRAFHRMKDLLNSDHYNTLEAILSTAVHFGQSYLLDAAFDLHNLSVQKFPENALCWYNFAVTVHRIRRLKTESGSLDDAIKLYGLAIAKDPLFVSAFVLRGIAHAYQGNKQLADEDWRSAIKIDPAHKASKMAAELLRDTHVRVGKFSLLMCPQLDAPLAYICP
jgi:TPR repeat protein/serine/threonine protein kinase/lipoprotein NlpI